MSNETQVLVVGAGPTGLVAAIALAQKGVDVQIVDAASSNRNGARASLIHCHTLEILDTIGAANVIAERGIRCDALKFRSTAEQPLVNIELSVLKEYTNFPFAVLISQSDVEEVLQKHLDAQGVRVQRGKEITGIKKIHGDKVEVLFADNSTIVTKYIIGADGAHSTVRHLVGIDFKNPKTGASYYDPNAPDIFQMALGDVYLEEPLPEQLGRNQPTAFLLDRYLLLIPLPSREPKKLVWRLILAMRDEVPHNPTIEYFQQELDKRNPFSTPITISSVNSSSRYRVRAALADAYTAKIGNSHVLLIGDAAHVHSPVGGQGMNLGICDAVSAANTIYAHLNAPGSSENRDSIIARYAKQRHEIGERVVGLSMIMTKFLAFGGGSKWKLALRNTVFKALMCIRLFRRQAAWRVSGLGNRVYDVV